MAFDLTGPRRVGGFKLFRYTRICRAVEAGSGGSGKSSVYRQIESSIAEISGHLASCKPSAAYVLLRSSRKLLLAGNEPRTYSLAFELAKLFHHYHHQIGSDLDDLKLADSLMTFGTKQAEREAAPAEVCKLRFGAYLFMGKKYGEHGKNYEALAMLKVCEAICDQPALVPDHYGRMEMQVGIAQALFMLNKELSGLKSLIEDRLDAAARIYLEHGLPEDHTAQEEIKKIVDHMVAAYILLGKPEKAAAYWY